MKKNICLVTWYNLGYNYGTILQAYATQNVIKNFGYNCEIIKYSLKNSNKVKKILIKYYFMLFNHYIHKRNYQMDKWIKNNLILSKKYNNFEELKENQFKYDAGVCGSDQIWNNNNDLIDPVYYLQFLEPEKRIAYSPSIGRDFISEPVKEKFIEYVNGIRYLSIREKKGAEIISELTGHNPLVTLDPTLLLNKKEWQKLLELEEFKEKGQEYIFVYLLSTNNEIIEKIEELSKNYKIIAFLPQKNHNFITINQNPTNFLNALLNAKYVITDSYHGMLFSINFQKKFVINKRFKEKDPKNQNSRIYNIIEKYGLEERLIDSHTKNIEKILVKDIDYSNIEKKLNKDIKKSSEYLKEALLNATKEGKRNDM